MHMSGATHGANAQNEMGTYEYIGVTNGRPAYQMQGGEYLYWASTNRYKGVDAWQWRVGTHLGGDSSVHIGSEDDVATPDLAKTWKTFREAVNTVGDVNTWAVDAGLVVVAQPCTGDCRTCTITYCPLTTLSLVRCRDETS